MEIDYMNVNIEEINRILNDIDFNDESQYVYNRPRCWNRWFNDFIDDKEFERVKSRMGKDAFSKSIEGIMNTDGSEETFRKRFPLYNYEKYISPWDYNLKVVSKKRIQEIAFTLQEHFPMEFNSLCTVLEKVYVSGNQAEKKWSIKDLLLLGNSYDRELCMGIRVAQAVKEVA